MILVGCSLSSSDLLSDAKDDRELQQFKQQMRTTFDDIRNWASSWFGYGADVISGKKSVEMLPYRYVFFVSFLGGISGALLIYYLHRATRTVNRYEFFEENDDAKKSRYMRPTTFRSVKNDKDDENDF
jgi:hypothetical protein